MPRLGIRSLVGLTLTAGLLALAVYSVWIEPRALQVTRLDLWQSGIEEDIRLVVMGDLAHMAQLQEMASAEA